MLSSLVLEHQGPPYLNKVWTLEAVGAAGFADTSATAALRG